MAVGLAEDDASTFYVIQLDTAAVSLRLAARWKGKARFGWNNGFIVVSLLLFYAMVACSVLGTYQRVRRGKQDAENWQLY